MITEGECAADLHGAEGCPFIISRRKGMVSDKTIAVSDATFAEQVLNSPTPVVVDFWAEWCGPCKAVAPIVEELAAVYDGRVRFAKVDVDENPDTAARYAIRSIPSLMFFQHGTLKDQLVGVHPNMRREVTSRVDRMLTSA
jgi:thioredoxin